MPYEEALPYLEELEAGESDEKPEFTEVGEIKAWVDQLSEGAPVVTLDSEAAQALAEGDTFGTSGSVSAELGVKGSFACLSAGFKVGGSASTVFSAAASNGTVTFSRDFSGEVAYGGPTCVRDVQALSGPWLNRIMPAPVLNGSDVNQVTPAAWRSSTLLPHPTGRVQIARTWATSSTDEGVK
jgi:hypothetical protein